MRGLRLLLAAVLVVVGASLATRSTAARTWHAPTARAHSRQPAARFLVLIVLDGARPDYLNEPNMPHVDALMQHGTQYAYAMDGILEAETPAGHTTISTGSTPRRNGILGFNWAENDRNYSLFNPDVVRAGAMERIMQNARVPTIAGLFKAKHPKEVVVALSGHKYYAADPLGGPAADVIMYFRGDMQHHYSPTSIPGHVPPDGILDAPGVTAPSTSLQLGDDDHLVTRLALAAFHKLRPHILLINYPDFDWPLGHVDGGNLAPKRVAYLMRAFDSDLGSIEAAYHKAHIFKKTLFVITADHGMAPLRHNVPDSVVRDAVAKAKTTAPSLAFNTAAYVWLRDIRKGPAVAENILAANKPGIQSVYYLASDGHKVWYAQAGGDVSSAQDAANRYLLGTLLDGHEPTVVVFCKEGASFAAPAINWKADHGGGSWQSQHIPLVFSGAGIRKGLVTGEPAQLEDIAPTVLTALGIRPAGMEGQVLNEVLTHPASRVWPGRVAEAKQLSPLIQAMITQDQYEVAHPGW